MTAEWNGRGITLTLAKEMVNSAVVCVGLAKESRYADVLERDTDILYVNCLLRLRQVH